MAAKSEFQRLAQHLLSVAQVAMSTGDKYRALIGWVRFSELAQSAQDQEEREIAKDFARKFARVLAKEPKTAAEALAKLPAGYIPPTPETAVRLKRKPHDPIDYMNLSEAQYQAAKEIRAIYESLTRGLQARGLDLATDKVDTSLVHKEPWMGMSHYLQSRMWSHFKPWRHRMRRVRIAEGRFTTPGDIVFLILFGLTPARWIDKALNLKRDTASGWFHYALDDYNTPTRLAP